MDHFSPSHQPDEGYSEEPINPAANLDIAALTSPVRNPSDLPSWLASNASLLSAKTKTDLAMALLDELPTSSIAEIVRRLSPRLYIDFIQYLPAEICIKVLGYLDPVSLICVTQTCRAWYDLGLDRKLWQQLYYLEGWKAVPSEIQAWEAKVNSGLNNSASHLHRIQTSEGRTSKIRALHNDDDDDLEMADSDRVLGTHDGSLVASPSMSPSTSNMARFGAAEMELDRSIFKGKGVDRTKSLGSRSRRTGIDDTLDSLPPILPTDNHSSSLGSTLGMWDSSSSRYRINWKYLYNMRRRLEQNWEQGKFTNFQLPHPNYPEEGHQECIYTIQFDSDYLVSGSRDHSIRKWNMRTRRLIGSPLVGHCGSVLCLQFDSDPEEDLLVSGSSDSDVFVWKFSTGEIIQKITKAHRESVLNVRFDKRVLITSSKDKTIKIFNRRPLRYGDVGYGSSEPFGPAARRIKQHGYEPDLAQELPIKEPWSLIGRLDGHTAAVNAIQILGDTVVSVSGDRHIKLWNWPKQVCTKTIPAHDKGIACVEYDGRRIVSGSSDYEVCIFDAITGLKIAQLRGHAALVRTVQAGFGDLPYSLVEDEIEARAVDNAYYRAVEAGEVPPYHMRTGPRQARRVNAGSSLPIDIQATGSMLPPGGGGGRKYSRIVSGSYDQTIIIWRRDKGGEWKPNHHLRQEEAAAAAQQRVSSPHDDDEPGGPSIPPLTDGQSNQLPSAQSQVGMSTADIAAHSRALIDQVVPLGVAQLAMLLQQHPALLLHHDYMQIAIEREHSPFLRTLLRQAVADALSMAQAIQASQPPNAGHATGDNAHPGPPFVAPVGQGHGMPPHYGMPAQVPAPPQRHHPHLTLAPPEPAPQRIFKLQFDAHQIVCCSQASTIVGWDFCNGDPELEQAVRFFATID